MRPRALVVVPLLVLVSCAVAVEGPRAPAPIPAADPAADPAVEPASVASPPQPVDDRLPPPAEPAEHVPEPWPFDVRHYALDIAVDPARHAISGSVRIDVDDAADGLSELPLDAVGLEIARVTERAPAERDVTFAYDGTKLRIPLGEPRRTGTSRTFTIAYSGRPARGIHFNDGDPPQVYTQGEMEDSRYWFPCHDFPDDRATHTLTVHVPSDRWHVICAGEGGLCSGTTWSYRLDVPHVSYLTTMTAGEYDVIDERGVVPLQFVVERRDMRFAAANFRETNDVLRFFGHYTGLAYPYPKYAQTCVRNFMYGGMENISATTLTDHTIHPPEWEPARSSTSLVAHEAAHQWFGDWITCADWSHCWLNEGFATYLDMLYTEHAEGRDGFLLELRGARQGALGAMDSERRAVVSNKYAEPFDLFDGHAYAGGAVRLHMLRHLLGGDAFRGAIRHYVKKCGLTCVTTDDFESAVEEFTGQDLTWFFDQWFRKPGYPVLKIRWTWDEAKKSAVVTVEQTQKTDGGVPEAYRLPLDVRFVTQEAAGTTVVELEQLQVSKRSETFEVRLAGAPKEVHVDPETALLSRFDLDRSAAELARAALGDGNPSWRLDAAEALAAIVKDDKRPAGDRDQAQLALLGAFASERFAPLRAALAGLVASRKDDATADVLIGAMNGDADLRVRLAAADALHGFEGNVRSRDALVLHLQDENDLMRASAVAGVAKLKHPVAFESLTAQVERPGWHSVVRNAALRGLADVGDERAFATLVRFAAPGDNWSRGAAIESLGRMGRKRPEYRDAVLPYLDDRERFVRQKAAEALGAMADPDTIATLVAHFAAEDWPGVKEALRNAAKACRAAAVEESRLVSVEAIRASEIRDRHAALRDEADALEPTIAAFAGDAKTAAEAKLKSLRDQMAPLQRDLDTLGVPVKPKPKPPAPAPATK